MTRYKVKKSTFIIAVLAILLCLVAITGATLALFTSDVKDGTIGINTTAGDVKVDIVDDSDETLVGKVLKFQSPTNEDVTFEPGATYYTQGFKVKNTGTITIKYLAYISEDEEISASDFSKAFEVWITTSTTTLESVTELTKFSDSLEVGKSSKTYYLVVKMKETAGNEFQNRKFKGIGITVSAVQGNVQGNVQGD